MLMDRLLLGLILIFRESYSNLVFGCFSSDKLYVYLFGVLGYGVFIR